MILLNSLEPKIGRNKGSQSDKSHLIPFHEYVKRRKLFSLIFKQFSAQIETYMRVSSKAINEKLNEKNSIECVLIMFKNEMSNDI